MVAIAASFAAPLVFASGLRNFALHFFGPTRAGKSTALLAAMSVYGLGREEDLPNWHSSEARRQEIPAAFGDIVFPLNEVGAMKGKKKDAYEKLRDLYAAYAEGGDLERHSSWQAGQGGEAMRFRGIFIATAEHSVAEYAETADETRDGGELFRAIDLPLVREGKKSIFDSLPRMFGERKALSSLHVAIRECHGTAFRPYLQFLLEKGAGDVKRLVDALIKEFVDHVSRASHDGVVAQVATNCALIYAGGSLGMKADLLPWNEQELLEAVTRCFEDAIAVFVVDPLPRALNVKAHLLDDQNVELKSTSTFGRGDALPRALNVLRAHLLDDQIVELKSTSTFGRGDHAGYWRRSGAKKLYIVNTPAFNSWFANIAERDLVLNYLVKKRLLSRAGAASSEVLTAGDKKGLTPLWPDHHRVRSFVFADPFPAALKPAVRPPTRPVTR
jgi:hypothetical protein